MTFTPYEETQLLPLTTDDQIERRVADLVGRAHTRQLWLLFLDEVDVQLPLLIPLEGLPLEPSHDETEQVVDRIRELMGEIGAASVITVIERYAAATLTIMDAAWARSLRESCERHGIALRAQLLSHRGGVRLIADDETVSA